MDVINAIMNYIITITTTEARLLVCLPAANAFIKQC